MIQILILINSKFFFALLFFLLIDLFIYFDVCEKKKKYRIEKKNVSYFLIDCCVNWRWKNENRLVWFADAVDAV